jgi:hypothetical protein
MRGTGAIGLPRQVVVERAAECGNAGVAVHALHLPREVAGVGEDQGQLLRRKDDVETSVPRTVPGRTAR